MKLNFGNQIRLNRRRMNLTQEQLAEKFGTSPQAISRWEIGATYPDIEMLPMIASFFETSVDSLLGVTEEEKEKRCSELQKSFEIAVRAKDVQKTVEIMREIRRNLKDYQQYWFWGMYNEIWKVRLFQDKSVLEEMRLLAEGGPPMFRSGSTCPIVLWILLAVSAFRLHVSHILWMAFPHHSTTLPQCFSQS